MPPPVRPDLAFLDRVHDWTFRKRTEQGVLSHDVLGVQARLRAKLRQAQRFIVDDDAVAVVAGLSREFNRLESWSFLARLPYDTMWLEFNLHHKIESLRRLDDRMLPVEPDIVSPVIGYLLFRDDPGSGSPVWIAHEFYQSPDDGSAYTGMLAYVFDPEGDPMWPVRGSKFWRSPTLSMRPGFPRMPVQVDWERKDADTIQIKTDAAPEIALCGIFQPVDGATIKFDADGIYGETELVTAPSWFVNRGAVIVNPWWDRYFARRWQDDPDRVHRLLMHEINESRGAMKFLIAMLAGINALPRDIRPIPPRAGTRTIGMNRLPFLGNSHLKITLPRDNRVVYARKTLDNMFSSGLRRRQHYVIGHWRVVERGKRVTHLCRHMPTMVENGLGMCENCEMLIRWIPQHTRGDPELGMVDHEYEVTTKKAAPRSPQPPGNEHNRPHPR